MKTNNPKIILFLIQAIIFFNFFQQGLFQVTKLSFLTYIDDLLIIIAIIFVLKNSGKDFNIKTSKYDYVILSILIVALIGSLFSSVPINIIILAVRGYFLYLLLFYIIYWSDLNKESINRIMYFILTLFFIQFLFAVFQFIDVIISGRSGLDNVSGTFGIANFLGYSAFLGFYLCFYNYYINKHTRYIYGTLALGFILIVTSARYAILLFPIIFLILNYKLILKKVTIKKIVVTLSFIIGAIILINQPFISGNYGSVFDYYTVSGIEKYINAEQDLALQSGSRLGWYPLTVDLLNHKAHNPLTGFGIGNYASFVAFKYSTTGNNILMSYFIYNPNKPIYIDSQIIPLLGEFGYLGLLLFIILFGLIIFRLRHILNIARSDLARTISSTTLAYSIFFCFGFFINRFLEQPNTSMLLFLFVGLSESIFITEKQGTSYDPNKKNQK